MASRYLLGLDLGTTNTALAYVDTHAPAPRVTSFAIPQLTAPGVIEPRAQLPSFVYLASEHDFAAGQLTLPWADVPLGKRPAGEPALRLVVGELARQAGAAMAARLVASAKSWLCHAGVDRLAPILPWGDSNGPRISPVEAQAYVLAHVRQAWDHAHRHQADSAFAEQEICITVPASFDEAARALTLDAARLAGYPNVALLEEPQAAFYAWLAAARQAGAPPALLSPTEAGDRASDAAPGLVLVFDVGGGTTDFSLFALGQAAHGEALERIAVGDHLLLGGDNIDLALAKRVEHRLLASSSRKLDVLQWHALVHAARQAKETILAQVGQGASGTAVPIVLAGRGARLIGSTLRDELVPEEVMAVLLDGFFPEVARDDLPSRGRAGLVEFGLPYATDAAITRHLAAFLQRHAVWTRATPIRAVLFNGGAMTPQVLRTRVCEMIGRWQGQVPQALEVATPELAVARGAAYYGLVRRALAPRIGGGTPRAFYVEVGDAADGQPVTAVCVAPKGLHEGAQCELPSEFVLVTNRPVRFRLFAGATRRDQLGDVVMLRSDPAEADVYVTDDGEPLQRLPPIVAALRAKAHAETRVRLRLHVTAFGAMELHCQASEGDARWKLEFDMRAGGQGGGVAQEAVDAHPRTGDACGALVQAFTGPADALPLLTKALDALLEGKRETWTMATARALFDVLAEHAATRLRSPGHEARWLTLAGVCVRPGFGAPLDAWRAKVMWGVFHEGLTYPKSEEAQLAWWIAWRRCAGGLGKGQQEQLFDRLAPQLLPTKQAKVDLKVSKEVTTEMWRTLGSLEQLPAAHKVRIGEAVVAKLGSKGARPDEPWLWVLGRVGARVPLYGASNTLVSPARVERWVSTLLAMPGVSDRWAFTVAQLARATGDRTRDLAEPVRHRVLAALAALPAYGREYALVERVTELDSRDVQIAWGDSLPAGLRFASATPQT